MHCQGSDLLNILPYAVVADVGNFAHGLDGIPLKVFILQVNCSEEALHDEISLFFVGEVRSCLRYRSVQCLDRDARQLQHLWVDVADRAVQNLTDLVIGKFLLEVVREELHHHAHRLHSCQSVVELFCCGVLGHGLQELVPLAVGHLDCGDDAEADACVLQRVPVLVLQHC